MKTINTIIIGAGHAGLALSYLLTKRGINHLVLERGEIGERWRSERWNSLHMIFPNYMTQLPGFKYAGKNPQGFDSKDQFIKFLEEYAKSFKAPVESNTNVISVNKQPRGFLVKTDKGNFEAKNVVVAIGSFHQPVIPNLSKSFPKNIYQIHSTQYKNPAKLPKGAVLVVGAGNSGVQIVDDLISAKRQTYLCVGKLRILPRRYRGKDSLTWMDEMGKLDLKASDLSPEAKKVVPPLLFGKNESVDIRKLSKKGVILLGRLKEVHGNEITLENNLEESLKNGDATLETFKDMVNEYIKAKRMYAPRAAAKISSNLKIESLTELDFKKANITSVIWATGYKDDFSWIKVPLLDKAGEPIHTRGVTKTPGLFLLGMRWLYKYKSFSIYGITEDAKYLSQQIS